jgi:hypothetical protein
MNDRDELLQERLAQLAAGEPLEELLDGLSADEAESLKLAATMGAVRFEQDETTVAYGHSCPGCLLVMDPPTVLD